MNIQSKTTFKRNRKTFGSVLALVHALIHSGVEAEQGDHFIDSILADLGYRKLEKMKTKNLYDIYDGYCLYIQEHHCPSFKEVPNY